MVLRALSRKEGYSSFTDPFYHDDSLLSASVRGIIYKNQRFSIESLELHGKGPHELPSVRKGIKYRTTPQE